MPVMVQPVAAAPLAVQVSDALPSLGAALAVYPVIADPPSHAGSVHDTAALAAPGDAVTPVGACGVMATPHLRARYSSTVRRSVAVTARFRTTSSPMSPSRSHSQDP